MFNRLKNMTAHEWRVSIGRLCLVFLGSVILAFGTAIFLTQLNIVSGGLAGIGIICQAHFPDTQIIDIVVFIATWVLWVIGLIFVGRGFAAKTFLSSLIYPLSLALFLRVNVFIDMAESIAGDGEIGRVLLCAIFGGVFVGAGVALTFVGGGSTGGLDVFCFILQKYVGIRESITCFVLDAIIVILGMTLIEDNVVNGLCGLISAFLCAAMVEIVYNRRGSSYQGDIISDHWEEISRYVQDELGRGATIIPAEGGYKGEKRTILRVVIDSTQLNKLRDYIASVDPSAFMTFTQVSAAYGEGFKSNKRTVPYGKKIKEVEKKEENNEDLQEKDEK